MRHDRACLDRQIDAGPQRLLCTIGCGLAKALHQSPAVSPGEGTMAFSKTSSRTGIRWHTELLWP